MVATGYMWLWSSWNAADAIEELQFKILFTLNKFESK